MFFNKKRQKGSSLLVVLILAATLMTIVAAVAYKSRISSLTATALDESFTKRMFVSNALENAYSKAVNESPADFSSGGLDFSFSYDSPGGGGADILGRELVSQGSLVSGSGGTEKINISVTDSEGKSVANIVKLREKGGISMLYSREYSSNNIVNAFSVPGLSDTDISALSSNQTDEMGAINNETKGSVRFIQRFSYLSSFYRFYSAENNSYTSYKNGPEADTSGLGPPRKATIRLKIFPRLKDGEWVFYYGGFYEDKFYYSESTLTDLLGDDYDTTGWTEIEYGDWNGAQGYANYDFGVLITDGAKKKPDFYMIPSVRWDNTVNSAIMRVYIKGYNPYSYTWNYNLAEVKYKLSGSKPYILDIRASSGYRTEEVLIVNDSAAANYFDVDENTAPFEYEGITFRLVRAPATAQPMMVAVNGQDIMVVPEGEEVAFYDYASNDNPTLALTNRNAVTCMAGSEVDSVELNMNLYFVRTKPNAGSVSICTYDSDLTRKSIDTFNLSSSAYPVTTYSNDKLSFFDLSTGTVIKKYGVDIDKPTTGGEELPSGIYFSRRV